jgi:hypothetical protein
MTDKTLSYSQALDGVLDAADVEGIVALVDQHKNWGQVTGRVPSYIIVKLVDEVKRLKEQQLSYYSEKKAVLTDASKGKSKS